MMNIQQRTGQGDAAAAVAGKRDSARSSAFAGPPANLSENRQAPRTVRLRTPSPSVRSGKQH
jgi:hypothetical protein